MENPGASLLKEQVKEHLQVPESDQQFVPRLTGRNCSGIDLILIAKVKPGLEEAGVKMEVDGQSWDLPEPSTFRPG